MHTESGWGVGVGGGVRQNDQYSHRWNFWQKCSFPFLSVSIGCMMFLFLGFPLRTTMLRRWGPRQCKAACVLGQLLFQQLCRTKSQRQCPETQLPRNNSDARQSIQLWGPSSTSLLIAPGLCHSFSSASCKFFGILVLISLFNSQTTSWWDCGSCSPLSCLFSTASS